MHVSFVLNCSLLYIGLNLKRQLSTFMYLLKFKVRSFYNVQFIGICTGKRQKLLFLYICFMSFVTFKFPPFLPYPIFRLSVSLYFIFLLKLNKIGCKKLKKAASVKYCREKKSTVHNFASIIEMFTARLYAIHICWLYLLSYKCRCIYQQQRTNAN